LIWNKQVRHRLDFFKIKPKLIFLFPLLISGFVFAPMAESAFAESFITQEKLVSLAIQPFAEKIVILDLENGKIKTLFIDPIMDIAESIAAQSDVISPSILLVSIPLAGLVFFRAEGLEVDQSLIRKLLGLVVIAVLFSMILVTPFAVAGYYYLPINENHHQTLDPPQSSTGESSDNPILDVTKDVALDFSFGYKLFDSENSFLDSLNFLSQFTSIDYYLPPAFAAVPAIILFEANDPDDLDSVCSILDKFVG